MQCPWCVLVLVLARAGVQSALHHNLTCFQPFTWCMQAFFGDDNVRACITHLYKLVQQQNESKQMPEGDEGSEVSDPNPPVVI